MIDLTNSNLILRLSPIRDHAVDVYVAQKSTGKRGFITRVNPRKGFDGGVRFYDGDLLFENEYEEISWDDFDRDFIIEDISIEYDPLFKDGIWEEVPRVVYLDRR